MVLYIGFAGYFVDADPFLRPLFLPSLLLTGAGTSSPSAGAVISALISSEPESSISDPVIPESFSLSVIVLAFHFRMQPIKAAQTAKECFCYSCRRYEFPHSLSYEPSFFSLQRSIHFILYLLMYRQRPIYPFRSLSYKNRPGQNAAASFSGSLNMCGGFTLFDGAARIVHIFLRSVISSIISHRLLQRYYKKAVFFDFSKKSPIFLCFA